MWKWLHHLFNPHCQECAQDIQCPTCEVYAQQLAIMNEQNRQLTLTIVDLTKPEMVEPRNHTAANPEALGKRRVPWKVRQAILEQEDRVKAKVIKEAPKPEEGITISSLEAELAEVEKKRTEHAH